jgi:hypothetical protein
MEGCAVADEVGVVVPGVPEGWELVGFRPAKMGEFVVGHDGSALELRGDSTFVCAVIRRAAPVCVWPRGVFADGWLVQDGDGEVCWFTHEPTWDSNDEDWSYCGVVPKGGGYARIHLICIANPPVFRSDAPYEKRIQRVGPVYEAGLVEKGGGQ